MTGLVYFIERIAPGLYLFAAAIFLVWFRRWLMSRRRLALAEFELERELAEQQKARAVTFSIATIQFALAIAAIAHVIAPTLRNDLLVVAPASNNGTAPERVETLGPATANAIVSLNLTLTAQALAGGGGPQILLTAVATPTNVGTILPGYPTPTDCTAGATLEIPATGQLLFDSVDVVGTADVPNFAFYKFEIAGPSTGGSFAPIGGDKFSPVPNKGFLGQFPLSRFQPGDYEFRLAVFDNSGVLRASCTISVRIQERPPTQTPPGGGSPIAPIATPTTPS